MFRSISVKPIKAEEIPPNPLKIAIICGRLGSFIREEINKLVMAPKIIIAITGIRWGRGSIVRLYRIAISIEMNAI